MGTRLGQNFLTDESIAKKIAESANLSSAGNVLEIGPGKGMLTKYLAPLAKNVLAIEIDRELAAHLENSDKNVEIVEGDVLKIDLPELIKSHRFGSYKVVANLPYYITSKIIRLLLETESPPSEMILMVQKEVAERIVALDGKESILSISVKLFAEPEILFIVSREKFSPVPKVDSAVVRIKRKKQIPNIDTNKFFSLVRAGFSSKRKMLANNLSAAFHLSKPKILEILNRAAVAPTIRAEKLSVEDWAGLNNQF